MLKCGSLHCILCIFYSFSHSFSDGFPLSFPFLPFVCVWDTRDMDDLYQASLTSFKSHSYADINSVQSCFLRQCHYSYRRENLLYSLPSYNIHKVLCYCYPISRTVSVNDGRSTHALATCGFYPLRGLLNNRCHGLVV